MQPKTFIQEELKNVRAILGETLRHDFNDDRDRFYEELDRRLSSLEREVSGTSDGEPATLESYSKLVSELSSCITLIERSHLGEFSWAFGHSFKTLAAKICQEQTLAAKFGSGEPRTPIFHLSADGGLASYKIVYDSETLLEFGKERIFNVVFPRTLKPHVLLHPVLAHELGHAALSIPNHAIAKARSPLQKSSSIATDSDLAVWLRNFRPGLPEVLPSQRESYIQEFLCDLFGLVLMGPPFASALCALLGAKDPTGKGTTADIPTHPPFHARRAVLQQASRLLKWSRLSTRQGGQTEALVSRYIQSISTAESLPFNASPFDDSYLSEALGYISDSLSGFSFEAVNQDSLADLIQNLELAVPPSSSRVTMDGRANLGVADFRLIIYAGWIYWANTSNPETVDFMNVNKLCDMGILHQIAIENM